MEGKNYKDYLNKTFLEELVYKVWSTKGTRFIASTRLTKTSSLSNLAISILTVYLIAISLLSVYNINFNTLNSNLIAYSITCLSILILVFSQIENAKDFTKKAKEFHNCGLELSKIYNKIRIFKTSGKLPSLEEKINFTEEMSDEYQRVLERHENHLQIDNQYFKTKTAEYHLLSCFDVIAIKLVYYINTVFIYHFLIVFPPIIITILLWLYK